jgi:hypothetical protein
LAPASATAAIVLVSYKGAASGTDGGGLFGAAGATYTSASFVTRYTFDENPNPTSPFGALLDVNITLNSATYDFGPLGFVDASDFANPGFARTTAMQRHVMLSDGWQYAALSNSLVSDITPADRTIAYAAPGGNLTSLASVWNGLFVSGNQSSRGGYYGTSLRFLADAITVNSSPSTPTECCGVGFAAIPDPAGWVSMILGAALAGSMVRRRRARSVA